MALTVSPTSNFRALPAEILLEIIPHVPYDPEHILTLQLTLRAFHELIIDHEQSLVAAIRKQQFKQSTLKLFPSLPHTLKGLSTLHNRLSTLADVHEQWLKITHNGPELHWLRDRWETAHKAGMLLLYRLQDNVAYEAKVKLIQSLPATSLACLVFKLYSSIKILRLYGPEPINLSYAAGDLVMRSDIELAFEEMLLTYGVSFFVVLLDSRAAGSQQRSWAVKQVRPYNNLTITNSGRVLKEEIFGMEDRQLPMPDGTPQRPTLTSVLRRAFAAQMCCHVAEVTSKMWEVLSGTIFDRVSEDMMVNLVNGEPIRRKGMRRMGF